MSFKLKFNFKIKNLTNNHLNNLKISDDEGVLHKEFSDTLSKNEFTNLEKVPMHLYKPENIYLKFLDDTGKEQELILFKDIKKDLKLTYDVIVEQTLNGYNAKFAKST
ncbi:hypothetical protein [uncultured Clostridium sp.]|uniref:hypothetical protein n=1 Tax=uncultured Clostridium sp. TaxID=59620 RepID=UPI00261A5BBD|nr:hypothetical protein [uncultured Clostridium sp.]